MAEIDIEALKQAGFTYEEIQEIISSEEEFEKDGITYDFEYVKSFTRKKLFSKTKVNV